MMMMMFSFCCWIRTVLTVAVVVRCGGAKSEQAAASRLSGLSLSQLLSALAGTDTIHTVQHTTQVVATASQLLAVDDDRTVVVVVVSW